MGKGTARTGEMGLGVYEALVPPLFTGVRGHGRGGYGFVARTS